MSPPRCRTARPCSPSRGIGPGDRVAVVDVGGLASTAVILGAARLGAAAALMNVQLKPSELQELVRTAGCSSVGVAGDPYRAALEAAVDGFVLGPSDIVAGGSEHGDTVENDELDALVLFTSGTTGLPKAIPISQGTLSQRLGSMMTAAVRPRTNRPSSA